MTKIFWDVETTGLLRVEAAPIQDQPHIIELCAIKTDDDCNIIGEFNEMFRPPIIFEETNDKGKGITQITGISNDMLKDKKPFGAHFQELANFFLGTDSMVAHNISFDRGCLVHEINRIKRMSYFPWPPTHECTIEQSMSFKNHRLNLQALHEHLFGVKFDGAHRAKSDVLAMLQCYKKMHLKGEFKNVAA